MLVDVVDMLSFGSGYVCWYIIRTIVDVMINIVVVVVMDCHCNECICYYVNNPPYPPHKRLHKT
jgi:hypothetical protein